MTRRVVVVGAGVAGLTVAHDLARRGLEVTVLEAGPAVGGCVAPVAVTGLPADVALDGGAESFATRTTAVADLIADVGLAEDVVLPRRLGSWVQHARRADLLPSAGLLGIPVDPWAEDVRRSIGLLGAARASLDRYLPASVGTSDDVTVAELVQARMGRRVLRRLVGPVVTGVHSSPPVALDADTAMPGVRVGVRETGSLAAAVARVRERAPAGAAAAGLRGGLHRLPTALQEAVSARGGTVLTGTAVQTIEHDGTWRVQADGATASADDVVLAVPGPVAAALLAPWARVEPPPTVPVSIVTLVLAVRDLDRAPRGTGVLVSPDSPVVAKGLTHSTAKWAWLEHAADGRHVVRLSYGRGGGMPATSLETALSDAAALLGTPLPRDRVLGWARTDWPQGLGAPPAGHRGRVAALRESLPEGLWVTGAWVAGTGLAAVVADARSTARGVERRAG
ncbi:protoporphyrinogen oxidase [Actinotalea sp. M2MS4P-6]|uniref:protoporphyrinogen oxidase n=1 Tax=Actinotalea sp. M2MS4P-6 TaxID=2983762 RepID=UPI0021E50C93|nr:protoporphyrinogen oxidase [Actinotalea sp. M2MS4P-6]MCV2392906.1 protoporphyrinogen oxidase [Actinotalea sp. M2MS4P-6]